MSDQDENPMEAFVLAYRNDPVLFVREILGVEPQSYQAEFLQALAAGERKISIRSGHGTGKSTAASWAMLWWLLLRFPNKVVVTAPTSGQLFDALFAELKRWINELPAPLKSMLTVKSDRIELNAAPSEAFISARTSRAETPEALAGVHCFAEGTVDVLTRNGWVALEDVSVSDDVLSKRVGEQTAHWEHPVEVIRKPYAGPMHSYKNRFIQYCVTPNHRFEYFKRQCNKTVGGGITERWEHRVGAVSDMPRQKCRIPKTFKMDDGGPLVHCVPEYTSTRYGQPLVTRGGNGDAIRQPHAISIDDWAEFMGWYLAEGFSTDRSSVICQSIQANPVKYARIVSLIQRMGYGPSLSDNQISIGNVQLASYMRSIIAKGAENKSLPAFCFDMPLSAKRRFLDAFRAGDGCGEWEYFTSSPAMADDLQRMILLCGSYATVNFTARKGTLVGGFDDKPASYRNTDYYRVREWKGWGADFAGIDVKNRSVIDFDGHVSCLRMASGMFYVRDRSTKHGFWTHNSEHVMLVVDEASGVPEAVFEAAAGSMSGHSAVTILLSNPTRSSGTFYESQTRLAGTWWTRRWSCVESNLVSTEFVDEMRLRYGEDSNAFRIRVLGEFPLADDDTIIPFHLAQSAMQRDMEPAKAGQIVWGLDVARFGSDKSALAERTGSVWTAVSSWQGLDLMQTVGRVKAQYDGLVPSLRPAEIMVDVIGMGGGVVDRLRELGLPVRGVNVSEAPSMGGTYTNLRSELWFKMRGMLEERTSKLPLNEQLLAELTSIRYSFSSNGKMKAESKDEMKRRGLHSPDIADAVCLTLASDAATAIGGKSTSWSKPLMRNLKGIA